MVATSAVIAIFAYAPMYLKLPVISFHNVRKKQKTKQNKNKNKNKQKKTQVDEGQRVILEIFSLSSK